MLILCDVHNKSKLSRNQIIAQKLADGVSAHTLAEEYGISVVRVYFVARKVIGRIPQEEIEADRKSIATEVITDMFGPIIARVECDEVSTEELLQILVKRVVPPK